MILQLLFDNENRLINKVEELPCVAVMQYLERASTQTLPGRAALGSDPFAQINTTNISNQVGPFFYMSFKPHNVLKRTWFLEAECETLHTNLLPHKPHPTINKNTFAVDLTQSDTITISTLRHSCTYTV